MMIGNLKGNQKNRKNQQQELVNLRWNIKKNWLMIQSTSLLIRKKVKKMEKMIMKKEKKLITKV